MMTITGMDSLMAKLEALAGGELLDAANGALEKGLLRIQQEAKANAPVQTGTLRQGIVTRMTRSESGSSGEVVSTAPYSVEVEMGSAAKRSPARPFMYPAFKANEASVRQEIAQAIRGVLG